MKAENRLSARDLSYTALTAVLMAVCSWLVVPGAVPFTMQTFAVFFALRLLGGKRGLLAIAVYILMGMCGLPVFAGFTGGIWRLIGPTGGYIVGFLPMALVYWAAEKRFCRTKRGAFIVLIIALALCYVLGTVWFTVVYTGESGAISFVSALTMCVLPFIVPDIVKLCLALWLAQVLKKYIKIA